MIKFYAFIECGDLLGVIQQDTREWEDKRVWGNFKSTHNMVGRCPAVEQPESYKEITEAEFHSYLEFGFPEHDHVGPFLMNDYQVWKYNERSKWMWVTYSKIEEGA